MTISVEVDSSKGWNNVFSLDNNFPTVYKEVEIDLSGFNGESDFKISFSIEDTQGGTTRYWYIDDVKLEGMIYK